DWNAAHLIQQDRGRWRQTRGIEWSLRCRIRLCAGSRDFAGHSHNADRGSEKVKIFGSSTHSSATLGSHRRPLVTRRIVGKGVICTLLLLAATAAVHSQTAAVSSDPVMRAMVNELERSVNELQFKDLDKPYFIQYVILDQERYRASATFGALTSSDTSQGRIVQAQVRVGDYEFDNSEFMTGPAFQGPPPSGVVFAAQLMHRYLVNSEGTRALQPSMLVAITIEAASEAPDGMRVRHWIPFNASSFDQVPSVEEISKSIVKMAADLTALRTAPVLEADYSGPVLFTGQASAEMFARV